MSASGYSLRATLYSALTTAKRPDVPVLVALRNTAGVVLPLAVGFATGHAVTGLGVAVGALIVMFSDQPAAYRQRLQIIATVSLAAAVSALLGFVVGAYAPAAIVTVIVAGFIGGLIVVFGPNMARVGMSSMILLVITAGSPLPWRQALAASGLILAGGLLQALISIAAWPLQRYRPERFALVTVYRDLAALARQQSPDTDAPPVSDALTALQQTLLGRHHARGRAMEAFRVLLELAERIRLELMALPEVQVSGTDDHASGTRIAAVLGAIADALQRGEPPTQAEQALHTLRTDAPNGLTHMDALIGQLAAATRNANWAGTRGEVRARSAEMKLPKALRSAAPMATLRANLNFSSVAFRHAVRWATCVALAMAVGRFAGLPHGYWLPMTAAIVLRPDFSATIKFGLLRVLGTVLGLILTTALLWLTPQDIWAHLVLMAALCFAFRYLATAHYGIAVAALTGTVVILLSFEGVASGAAVTDRVINTALGSGMALLAYFLWPTWERGRARDALADMLAAYADYLRTLTAASGTGTLRGDARTAGRVARSNAQASLARLRAEPGTDARLVELAEALFANSNRLARTAMALEANLELPFDVALHPDLTDFIDEAARALSMITACLHTHRPLDATPDLRTRQRALVAALPATETLARLSDRLVDNIDTLVHVTQRSQTQSIPLQAK